MRTTFFKAWPVEYFSTLNLTEYILMILRGRINWFITRKSKLQSTHFAVNFFFHRNPWKMVVFIMVIMFSKLSTGAGNHCQWSVHSAEHDKHLFYPLERLPAVLQCISRIIALSIKLCHDCWVGEVFILIRKRMNVSLNSKNSKIFDFPVKLLPDKTIVEIWFSLTNKWFHCYFVYYFVLQK